MLSTLQEMTMAVFAYKAKRYSGAQATIALAIGFAGQMKNWGDNFLDAETREKILNHHYTKPKDDATVVIIEEGPEMLIHTITLHLIGNPKKEQASFKTIFINLRCPTLSDYRWYKDVFLTNVLKREDCI